MKPILEIKNISKKFSIGGARQPYLSLRDSLSSWLRPAGRQEDFWALRDISFEVNPGESIGIIGRNGAGKSTLLKVLSRITPPTDGSILCRGRVASLLEVGTGFHPELTGRENVYMNGSILGMRRKEIDRNFDAIVDFAGVSQFIETPLKHYSSGMQLRLAFAVAAFLENEILIIDEVLAVGDAEFQKKCIGKMEDVSRSGRTVLFVSHNMTAVRKLCTKAVLLKNGRLDASGASSEIVDRYLLAGETIHHRVWTEEEAPGNKTVRLLEAQAFADANEESLFIDQPVNLQFRLKLADHNAIKGKINLSLMLTTQEEVLAFNVASISKKAASNEFTATCHIPAELLNDEQYFVRLMVVENEAVALADMHDVLSFKMEERQRNSSWHGKWPGAVRPQNLVRWTY